MAEITIPRTGAHLRKLFEILMPHPQGLQAGVALNKLAACVKMTPYEAGIYESSGKPRFEKIIRFATIDLCKAGWLLKNKGVWSVTEAGKTAFDSYPNPEDFYREAIRLYREWKQSAVNTEEVGSLEELSPAVTAKASDVTFEEAEEQASKEINAYLQKMPAYEFQELVADLLRGLDYHIEWVAPPGKDGGVDIIAHIDPLGTKAPRLKVQVKGGSQTIDLPKLKSFLANIENNDVGLYVSLGGFTKDAEESARTQINRKVTLINVERLVALWIEIYEKLDQKARQRFPLAPIYFLTLED